MMPLEQLRASFPDLLIALDFDGPIAPIVDDPDDSRPVAAAVPLLHRLADLGVHVAIVTGRDVKTLIRLSGLGEVSGLQVLGIHGAQRWTGGVLTQIEPPRAMQTLRDVLPGLVSGIDEEMWIEDKELSLVVHARRAAHPDRAMDELRSAAGACKEFPDIDIHEGKMILEFRMPGIDKGRALETLLLELDPGAALFAGDDHGDLPGFAALRAWSQRTGRSSLNVAIGELDATRESADHHCDDAASLMALLDSLLPDSTP